MTFYQRHIPQWLAISISIISLMAPPSIEKALSAAPQQTAKLQLPHNRIINSVKRAGMRPAIVEYVLDYYQRNFDRIENRRYITIIDYSKHSSEQRMLIIDTQTGQVGSYLTAHGKNSDPDNDGRATIFSNEPGSKTTSLGFYLASETYVGRHGLSLRLDGLETSNDNARKRAIVIHGAAYVSNKANRAGRSWGCPAIPAELAQTVINKLKGGSLLFAYHPSFYAKLTRSPDSDS